MKYLLRDNKGTFGYIKNQRMFEIIKTIILFAMALGIFFIGYCTLGTKKSLWTVFSILAMLPACKSLVGVIMLARFNSITKEMYDKYMESAGNIKCIFENVLTTSQKSYYVPVIACENNTIIGYVISKKASDVKDVTEHLENVLNNAGHKSIVVKIFDKEDAFLSRLKQMNENLSDNRLASSEDIFTTIKAVSL